MFNKLAGTFPRTDPYPICSERSDTDPVQNRTGSTTLLCYMVNTNVHDMMPNLLSEKGKKWN